MTTFRINGQEHELDVPDDMPLLWVLRDVVGLTGTKFGCGVALCGACTVHLDGRPIRSCITPVASVAGKPITTIEAIGETAKRQKIQQAWLEHRSGAMRLLPVGPDHVGRGAASRAIRIRAMPRSMRPCRAISAVAAPIRASAPPSSRHRSPLKAESEPAWASTTVCDRDELERQAGGVSRRTFLVTGAAAGGGLLLGVYLPRFDRRQGRRPPMETLRPQRLRPHRPDDSITLVMPQVEMGQGTYTSMPMLIAEELEVDLAQGEPRSRAAERQALCQSAARVPGDRRLDIGAGLLGAAAPRRRDRARHADRGGGGSVERRSGLLPRRKGRGDPSADRAEAEIWRSGRRGGEAAGAGQGRAQGPQGLHPDRHAGQAPRHAGEGERQGRVRHRRDDSRHEVRDRRGVSGLWRQARQASTTARRMAIKGVRQVVRIDNAVAVVGDHMWAAMQGLAALDIEWDEGPNAKVSTATSLQQMAARLAEARRGRAQRRRRRQGDAGRRQEDRGGLRDAVPGACRHGADELHGPCAPRTAARSGSESRW